MKEQEYSEIQEELKDDGFGWLDFLNHQNLSYFKQPEYLKSSWIYVTFNDYYGIHQPWNTIGSPIGKETFVVHNVEMHGDEKGKYGKLFYLAEVYNIKRIIFSRCIFDKEIKLHLTPNIKEVVINECKSAMLIFPTIFNFFGGEKYGLRSFILRKSNNVSFDLRLINTCLSYAHYIRDVKLLSCNCMPLTLKDNKKIGIEWYQEGKKQLDTTLEKNNKGYKNCERICLAFLSNRIRKVSSLFKYQERQLINEVVKLIWSSRYKDEWYL